MSSFAELLPEIEDEDTVEYIESMILAGVDDGGVDEEVKEAVNSMIEGSLEDSHQTEEIATLIEMFWSKCAASHGGQVNCNASSGDDGDTTTALLKESVKMSDTDICSSGTGGIKASSEDDGGQARSTLDYSSFFANQIGIRTERAVSEKARRKKKQLEVSNGRLSLSCLPWLGIDLRT